MRAQYLRACAAAGGAFLLSLAAAVYSAVAFDPSQQPFGYAPSVAVSGFDVSRGDQQVFQTWFDGTYWRGDLVAYQLDETGNTDDTSRLWFASEKLAAQNWDTGRRIVTRNGNVNVGFRWAELSAAQQSGLGDATTGPKLVNFLRGDRNNEKQFIEVEGDGTQVVLSGSATGIFRARGSVLGDIIHGKPVYVGKPAAAYTFNQYQAFKTANKARPGVVYVGANDGMVHAFDAATGNEVFAYIPSMVVPSLKALSTDPYTHTYFVDGPLAVGDVTSSGGSDWHTVLVGGLGAGGKGLFALDVTTGTAADETAAKAKILWEITPASTGFAELGYTYSSPAIVRLNDGRWAAVVGNGYNNTGNGHAVLYVIDAMTGALIKAIDTGSGAVGNPNGLSSPTAVDKNFDGKSDYIYAGDINGNMWKFDLSSASAGSWTSTLLFDGAATARPIIGAPDVADHPLGGYMVYFATGDLFTQARATDKLVQNYAYGIWDGAPAANKSMLDQTLTEAKHGTRRVRVSSATPINWDDASDPNNKKLNNGWRTALPPGEHVVGTGFLRDGRYHFTSTNPSVDNIAPPDGENWLMELDYLNGSTTGKLVFDLDGDQTLTSGDRVQSANGTPNLTNTGIPVGIYLGGGLFSQPVMVLLDAKFSTTLFNRIPSASPADIPGEPGTPPTTTGGGVEKGHFDFDSYHGVNTGSFKHTHEYDDKYDVVGANFLNASDSIYNLGNTSNSGNRVTGASEFFVLVANGDMSPGVTLTIASQDYKVYEFANKFDGTQKTYTLANVGLFQFKMPVDAFESRDWGTGIVRPGLIPTVTGCVKSNAPGQFGEVHSGALTIQIVKKGAPASAIQPNVAGKPEKGYKVVDDAWLLQKYTVFWHYGQCYGQNGWEMAPTPVYHANTGQVAVSAGSADPKAGDLPNLGPPLTPIGTTSVFTPAPGNTSGTNGKAGTRVTTTNYTDGSKDVITEVYDKKGRLVSRTSVRVSGGTPAKPGIDQGSTQPVYFDPLTAPPQSRGGAKVGRIGWHELIKD